MLHHQSRPYEIGLFHCWIYCCWTFHQYKPAVYHIWCTTVCIAMTSSSMGPRNFTTSSWSNTSRSNNTKCRSIHLDNPSQTQCHIEEANPGVSFKFYMTSHHTFVRIHTHKLAHFDKLDNIGLGIGCNECLNTNIENKIIAGRRRLVWSVWIWMGKNWGQECAWACLGLNYHCLHWVGRWCACQWSG